MAAKGEQRIKVSPNGPYVVTGGVPISRQVIDVDEGGNAREWRQTHAYETQHDYLLCRCGNSQNKPFCDDSHLRMRFDGSESPKARPPYADLAREFDGPKRLLTDARPLCVHARFCNPFGSVWKLVEETDRESVQRLFDHMVGNCPSGRLIAWSRGTAEAFEPEFQPSIAVVEAPALGISGPLWVRGGIPIESGTDSHVYELRNRLTLCRCGQSRNKPFCDGTHAAIGFRDGSPELESVQA
ncbi:MAG TPA: CDGSH iron-sulfur domain-containing protein [Gaiellaceae bacterium]